MRKNAKLYLLSWALCFMWTKNYCLHKKLKFWMKGPDWKDQKSSSKYNPFMFSLRIIYTLCLMDKKENRLREPTNRLILILDESNWVHVRKPALIISYRNQNCPTGKCPKTPRWNQYIPVWKAISDGNIFTFIYGRLVHNFIIFWHVEHQKET